MIDRSKFELELAEFFNALADRAPMDVDGVAMAAAIARERRGFRWPSIPRSASAPAYLVLALGLLLTLLVSAIAAGVLRNLPSPPLAGNGVIAYSVGDVADRPFAGHVHLMNADGTEDHEIAEGTTAGFSADGSLLSYVSGGGHIDPSLNDARLMLAHADGSFPRVTVRGLQSDFLLSPDASKLAVIAGDNNGQFVVGGDIWVINVADGTRRLLVPAPAPSEPQVAFALAAWSPDRTSIAFTINSTATYADGTPFTCSRGIDVVDVASGQLRHLTSRPIGDSLSVTWVPDGQAIAYVGWPDGTPHLPLGRGCVWADGSLGPAEDVFVIRADGTGERNLTNSPEAESLPRWSPDGESIAYAVGDRSSAEFSGRLAVLALDGLEPAAAPVLGPVVNAGPLVWSPDGTALLFVNSVGSFSYSDSGSYRSTGSIQVIDAGMVGAPVTLVNADHPIWSVSWQRLP